MPPQPPDFAPHPLPPALREARLQEVRQPTSDDIVLATHGPAGSGHWLLSAHPVGARFTQTFAPGKNAPQPSQFLLWLRTRLAGALIEGLAVAGGQLADLVWQGKDGTFHLALEMNGRDSNVLLLDGNQRILQALRTPKSGAAIGEVYQPPQKLHRYPKTDPPRLPVDGDAARALDTRWVALVTEEKLRGTRDGALRRVKAALGKARRRLEHIEGDRAAAQGAEAVREEAELLQIHRHRLKPGMRELTVPNEFAPERPEVTITLDPALGAAENIARRFQRYQKQRDAMSHVERRMADTQREITRWEALQARLAAAADAEAMEALLAALSPAERKVVAPAPPRVRRGEDVPVGVMTRTSADGYTIYVGRSKTENDEVTFRIGRGRDWWLHALGVPGAHVIVRNPNDGSLPPLTLRQAAWLAAYYSKGRKQGGLEVTCTQRKHVRKVKGGEPGQVT
ncbi:MAG TPA: NFACT RNA binding domain-containing protein, partial [bacterium]